VPHKGGRWVGSLWMLSGALSGEVGGERAGKKQNCMNAHGIKSLEDEWVE